MTGDGTVPKTLDRHPGEPAHGTWRRESDGKAADLLSRDDYPVTADCGKCGGRIRLEYLTQMEWRHAPVRGEAPAA